MFSNNRGQVRFPRESLELVFIPTWNGRTRLLVVSSASQSVSRSGDPCWGMVMLSYLLSELGLVWVRARRKVLQNGPYGAPVNYSNYVIRLLLTSGYLYDNRITSIQFWTFILVATLTGRYLQSATRHDDGLDRIHLSDSPRTDTVRSNGPNGVVPFKDNTLIAGEGFQSNLMNGCLVSLAILLGKDHKAYGRK